jgi:hypothetical protein
MIVKGLGRCGFLKTLQKDFQAKDIELDTNFFLLMIIIHNVCDKDLEDLGVLGRII